MGDSIRDTISEFLHEVEPERYYLRFDTKDESYPEEDRTVAEELKYRIQNKLSQEFHATVISVVIKYLDTEISQRYEKLYEKGSPFEIEIESLQDAGEIINFRGYLQVTGVDKFNWATFQSRKATHEEIKQYFLDSLKPILKTFKTSTLAITDADELVEMQNFVNKCANQALVEQFGLIVNIRNWDRDRTESQVDQAVLAKKIQSN
jgi:ribosomal protein S1